MMGFFAYHIRMLSEVLRAGCEPTAGHSHLSTPDSILMCHAVYQIMPSYVRK